MTIDTNSVFWREWSHRNKEDYWGTPSKDDKKQAEAVVKKAYLWIIAQGESPEEVAKTMAAMGE